MVGPKSKAAIFQGNDRTSRPPSRNPHAALILAPAQPFSHSQPFKNIYVRWQHGLAKSQIPHACVKGDPPRHWPGGPILWSRRTSFSVPFPPNPLRLAEETAIASSKISWFRSNARLWEKERNTGFSLISYEALIMYFSPNFLKQILVVIYL